MIQGPKGQEEEPAEWVGKKIIFLETGCLLLGQEGIISMCEHEFGEIPHDQLRLNMLVAYHIIAVPEAD